MNPVNNTTIDRSDVPPAPARPASRSASARVFAAALLALAPAAAALAPLALPQTASAQSGGSGASFGARTATPEQRAEFNKLLRQRDELYGRLRMLDAQSVRALKEGKSTVSLYAEQAGVQDQLDLVELHLELQATRHGLNIPPAPGAGGDDGGGDSAGPSDAGAPSDARLDRAFARGRNRAVGELARQTESFLSSLDFRAFLNQ